MFLNKYKSVFINLSLVFFLIVLDQFCKKLSVNISTNDFGFLGFSLQPPIKNYGFIFGLDFSGSALFIEPVLTAIFLLFLFYYIVCLFFTPQKFYYLKIGLSLLFAGFASNLISKFLDFYVLDFIKWSPFNLYFNLADILQTFGWLTVLSQLIVLKKYIWTENERRKSLLVMKKFQIQFLAYCSSIFVLVSVFFILLNRQFVNFIELTEGQDLKQLSSAFFSYCFFILILIYFSVGMFFLYISNKVFGPVYAFERYMRKLLDNKDFKEDFQLRRNDQLKQLEDLAKDIKKKLK